MMEVERSPLSNALSSTADPPGNKKKTVVFVSYIREEREQAMEFVNALKDADLGLEPWIDTSIRPGQVWENEIEKAIQTSRYFISLISSTAVQKKGYTRKEFEYALNVMKQTQQRKKIIVIPVRLDDCKIPYSDLEKIQFVDLFPDWKAGFEKILDAIELGDNLVDGQQFMFRKRFNRFRKLANLIRRQPDINITVDPSELSTLLQQRSTINTDRKSVTNPHYTKSYVPYSSSSLLSRKGSNDGQLKNPTGITIDRTSTYLYVTDKDNHRIQKFDSTGRYIAKWGSKGSRDGQFDNPTGITIDQATDHVYVTDKDNHRIQKFDSNGNFITKWGSKGSHYGQFDNPMSLCINMIDGCIFVVDSNNHRIHLFIPRDADVRIRDGISAFSSRNYDEASKCFEQAIKIDQSYAYAWNNRGACLYQLQDYEEASKCFEQAIKIDENYTYAWNNRGKISIQKGQYQVAIKIFEKINKIDHGNIEALNYRGLMYYFSHESEKAVACIDEALRIDPRDSDAVYFKNFISEDILKR
jgi:tetratricopeptide (TPR) repeat protein